MTQKTWLNANLKYVSLVTMIVQTTALVLSLRYSRTIATDGPRYINSAAVLMSEIVKTLTAAILIYMQHQMDVVRTMQDFNSNCVANSRDFLKVSVPALLYVVQNNLLFLALSKLDAATYQVTYQLKILTTAIFSVTLLGRQLNKHKWIALVVLMIGVALVQMPSGDKSATVTEQSVGDQMVGLIAVIGACVTSGFSGVYMEKILKTSDVSIWMRNFQLAFFSIFGSFLMVYLYDWPKVTDAGLLQGFNYFVWLCVFQQAYGGFVIAIVMKYADNILKGFAVSLSIILSSFISYAFLGDLQLNGFFLIGTTCVIGSTFLYGYEPSKKSLPQTNQ